jgi:hypothetical protein
MPSRSQVPPSETDWVTDAFQHGVTLVTSDGNVLAFGLVGLLAIGSMLSNDWRYETGEISGLPTVRGSDGRSYAYKLLPGGKVVEIYLPSGRLEEHTVTSAASRDERQLSDEVTALIEDLYLEG